MDEQLKAGTAMKTILFYGDSNTYGYDPRGFGGGRYPKDVRWTDRLAEAPGGDWRVLVNAMNGREIPDRERSVNSVLEMIGTAAEEHAQLRFAVMLGTNDLFSAGRFSPSMTVSRKMSLFLDRIRNTFPEMPVLLIAPPPVGAADAIDPEEQRLYRESRQLSLLYHILAEQKGADFTSAFDWQVPLSFDGVHLSEEGHRVFFEKMREALKDI